MILSTMHDPVTKAWFGHQNMILYQSMILSPKHDPVAKEWPFHQSMNLSPKNSFINTLMTDMNTNCS
jgi:hypothetical protein